LVGFIQKPYQYAELLAKLRATISGCTARRAEPL
jgi:hypothetical protein